MKLSVISQYLPELNVMIKLLRFKHWQLFGLLFVVPMIFQSLAMLSILETGKPTIMLVVFPIMMLLYVGILFGWLYELGTNLYEKLPETVNMNLGKFKTCIFIPVAYILLILIFLLGMAFQISVDPNPLVFILLIPIHVFSMFCIFYCLYFNAKALKAVEWQKNVNFSDYSGEFFLLWFFPFGIWILQPRINKLFDDNG
ncbi:MAG: hypothetical protein H7Y04_04545 [Verrucomicrobia bacterium]|nr:hypothetical protein [Cytophagales bacterium]